MRILFVTTYSPWPPVSGGAWRSYKELEHLSASHEVTVALAHDAGPGDAFHAEPGLPVGRTVLGYSPRLRRRDRLAALAGRNLLFLEYAPLQLRNRWRASFLETCESLRPDVVWISELGSFWRIGAAPGIPTVADMADIQSIKEARSLAVGLGLPPSALMLGTDGLGLPARPGLQWSYYRDGLLRRSRQARAQATVLHVALAERAMLRASDVAVLANPEDAPYVERLTRCAIVPNGFAFDGWPPRREPGRTLVFFGLLTYQPNIDGLRWFCERVWPLVLEQVPDARFDVIGRYAGDLDFASSRPNVTVHGFVEDLSEAVDRSCALVVPLLSGGGTRLKILEAWARRLPVVATPIGAEGLEARDGEHLLVAEEPAAFAAACGRLLTEPALGPQLAEAGFAHGRERFDWSQVLPRVSDALTAARSSRST